MYFEATLLTRILMYLYCIFEPVFLFFITVHVLMFIQYLCKACVFQIFAQIIFFHIQSCLIMSQILSLYSYYLSNFLRLFFGFRLSLPIFSFVNHVIDSMRSIFVWRWVFSFDVFFVQKKTLIFYGANICFTKYFSIFFLK